MYMYMYMNVYVYIWYYFVLMHIFLYTMYTTLFCAQSYFCTALDTIVYNIVLCSVIFNHSKTRPAHGKHSCLYISIGKKNISIRSLTLEENVARLRRKSWVRDRLEALFAHLRMEVTILCVACSWKFYLRKLVLEDMDCMSRSNTHFPPVMQNSP